MDIAATPLSTVPGRRPRLAAFAARCAEPWMAVLLFVYFLFGFVGSYPLSGADFAAVSGATNPTRQIVLIGLFLGSLPVLFVYRWALFDLGRRVLPLLAIYAWIGMTALWSAHPPLTLRRVAAEVLVLAVLAAAVVAARSWRTLVYPIALAATLVIIANIAAVVLLPGLAFGPLGAMGIHTNKNLAGVVTLVSLIIVGGTCLAVPNRRLKALLLPVLAIGVVFLLLTKSKTSLGLLILAAVAFPPLYLAIRRWSVAPAVVPVAMVSALALAIAVAAALDVPATAVSELLFGDPTLTRRTELWAYLHANIAQRPLLGWGWGAFWDTGADINPINAPPQSWVLGAREINTAHSGYIDMWLQAGLVGLLLVLVVLGRFVQVAVGLLRTGGHGGGETARLVATLLCLVLVLALYNVMESIIFRPSDTLSGLVVLAVLASEALAGRRAVPAMLAPGRHPGHHPGRGRGASAPPTPARSPAVRR